MKIIGDLQVLGNKSMLQFNPDIEINLEYSGWITNEYVEVNVAISQGLYFNSNTNMWKLAQANSMMTMPCRAIALENKSAGQLCKILRYGTFRNDSWTLSTMGLYISPITAGLLTTTSPSSSGNIVQLIATPTNVKVAFFDFCPMCIEIA